jgi:predicted DNA-binding transcriptional regulator AlpA
MRVQTHAAPGRVHNIRASSRVGYLTAGEVVARYSTSMSWILRRQRDSGFPAAVKFGAGRFRFWKLSELEAWERKKGSTVQ